MVTKRTVCAWSSDGISTHVLTPSTNVYHIDGDLSSLMRMLGIAEVDNERMMQVGTGVVRPLAGKINIVVDGGSSRFEIEEENGVPKEITEDDTTVRIY